ncbi:MAG TPA: hypothetical protein VFL04_02615 [Rectinemataceae bacterium]|nr:hypothetical protein [Rectinemataceae bacterium]
MKTQAIVLLGLVGLAVLGLLVWLFFLKGPDLRPYLGLKEPRARTMGPERVLEVEFSGPADTAIPQAFGQLFKTYYSLKGSPKGPAMKPPKARYRIPADSGPGAEERLREFKNHPWTGSVAIPLPDSVELPAEKAGAGGAVARVGTWDYGEVAEILHLGSYDTEPATIQRLEDFMKAKGLKPIGDHEEEYLKGPGMPLVSPKDYWTIIRYRVAKAD